MFNVISYVIHNVICSLIHYIICNIIQNVICDVSFILLTKGADAVLMHNSLIKHFTVYLLAAIFLNLTLKLLTQFPASNYENAIHLLKISIYRIIEFD